MSKSPTQIRCTSHLPEQPVEALGATGVILGDKGAKLIGQIKQNGAGFENPCFR